MSDVTLFIWIKDKGTRVTEGKSTNINALRYHLVLYVLQLKRHERMKVPVKPSLSFHCASFGSTVESVVRYSLCVHM